MNFKYRPTEEAKEKLCDLFVRCVEISTNTEHDVFLFFAPHVGTYKVFAHLKGWEADKNPLWLTSPDDLTEITVENIEATMAKLDELEVAENV